MDPTSPEGRIEYLEEEVEELRKRIEDLEGKLKGHTHRLAGSPITKIIGTVLPKDGIVIPSVEG